MRAVGLAHTFIVFLTAVIRAIDVHADLLRVSIAHAGNDHRLGANEAPPAILSIYLGEELSAVVDALVNGAPREGRGGPASMRLGVTTLPPLPRDSTDRNRTSPFAFTGNKFEFRAVGSSQSIARPNVFLNTIVADSLAELADAIEQRMSQGIALETATQQVVQATLGAHRRVIFNGNGYSPEWHAEAERRGLPNLPAAVDAIARYKAPDKLEMFERFGVLTRKEVESRVHVMFEGYSKAIMIEAQTALGMASTMILPAAFRYQKQLADSIESVRRLGAEAVNRQEGRLVLTATRIESALAALDALQQRLDAIESHASSPEAHARACREQLTPAIASLRESCDALELLVDDELWPLPKYSEMLFIH